MRRSAAAGRVNDHIAAVSCAPCLFRRPSVRQAGGDTAKGSPASCNTAGRADDGRVFAQRKVAVPFAFSDKRYADSADQQTAAAVRPKLRARHDAALWATRTRAPRDIPRPADTDRHVSARPLRAGRRQKDGAAPPNVVEGILLGKTARAPNHKPFEKSDGRAPNTCAKHQGAGVAVWAGAGQRRVTAAARLAYTPARRAFFGPHRRRRFVALRLLGVAGEVAGQV